MARHESRLYWPIIAAAKKADWALYRIEDAGPVKRPCDIMGCSPDGRAVALEVKWLDGPLPVRPDVSMMASHQSSWLDLFYKRGGIGVLAIYSARDKRFELWALCGENQWKLTWAIGEYEGGLLPTWPSRI